jgi:hypothetical protein
MFWNVVTWLKGIPSSSSHALVGGMIGAGVAHAGMDRHPMDGPQQDADRDRPFADARHDPVDAHHAGQQLAVHAATRAVRSELPRTAPRLLRPLIR